MAATLTKKMHEGTSATRLLSAYLVMALVLAVVGPGLSVYAAEGEVLPEVADTVAAEEAVVSEPASEPPDPAPESVTPEPVTPEPAVESTPVTAAPAEPVPVQPDPVALVLPAPVLTLASVTPVLSPDANPPLTSGGVRIEAPESGTYTAATVNDSKPVVPADFSIQLTTWETDAGWFVSFTSNYPISLVVVKGGNAGANLYAYDPPVYSDTALHAPANPNGKWAGLSHLDFYFGTLPEEPETGDVLVHKFYDENGNGTYEPALGEYLLEGWEFTLSGPAAEIAASVVETGTTGSDGMVLFTGLLPGTYSVTETLKAGWDNTTALTQSATVVAGEVQHLYFGNKPEVQEPETGDLLVHKFYDENINGIYEPAFGEYLLEGWEFTVTASEFSDSGTTGVGGTVLFAGLVPGTYSVTETLKAGWDNTTALTQSVQVAAGQTAHLYFGNMEESLPFTELDLAITKLADRESANPGDIISYTLTYRNLGDLAAENYTIVDDYDERYVTVVNANGGTVSGGKITWNFAGPLSKEDGPQTLTYTVRVVNPMPNGTTFVDNVVVISHPLDADPANNRDDERVTVRVTPAEPFLPFTGGEAWLLAAAALLTGIAGTVLRVRRVS